MSPADRPPGLPVPLFFGPDARRLCGWYHAPRIAARAAMEGLVICSPIGQEDISAHRALRHLAKAAAQHGVHALRFDYDGCGDSGGDDLDPDRVQSWLASIHAAIDELKRRAGVAHVCLLGVRLGALLAALAASGRTDVSSLVAIAPVISGRAFVREWNALSLVREWKAPDPDTGAPTLAANGGTGTEIEAAGFVMSRATRDDIACIDLLKQGRIADEVLLIDRDDLPRRDKWAAHLVAAGAKVTHEVLPGYRAMMSEPHNTSVPAAIVARVMQWLSRPGAVAATPASPDVRRSDESRAVHRQYPRAVCETLVHVDDDGLQFGILSEPERLAQDAESRRGLVLLNSGACRHIGPNRMYVPLARHLAARGWAVLRVDVSGLGDSEPHSGQPENAPYTAQGLRDIARWVAFLHECGIDEVHLLGICSGAYHAFKAAAAGMPLTSVIPINPLTFFWRDGMPLDPPLSDDRVVRMAAYYKGSMANPRKWLKLLSGRSEVVHPTKVLLRRAWFRAKSEFRHFVRVLGIRLRDDLPAELRAVRAHGVRLGFFFSDGDPGLVVLREQGGSIVDRLAQDDCLSIDMLPGTDHTFATEAARKSLLTALEAYLLRPPTHRTALHQQTGQATVAPTGSVVR